MFNWIGRLRNLLMWPCPRRYQFIFRIDGRIVLRMTFETLMYMTALQGREHFVLDVSGSPDVLINGRPLPRLKKHD